jgi:hypothetical protein
MPVKLGKKKFKTFKGAASSIAKKKGISKKRAAAYVAKVEMLRTGRHPRTGKPVKVKRRKSTRRRKRK